MKLARVLLNKAVMIGGDIRTDWDVEKHGVSMWLDGHVLHITRKGVHFMATDFAGAWVLEEEKPKTAKAKPAAESPA
jgi:hypothetical protein